MKLIEKIEQLSSCEITSIPFINLFLDTRMSETGKRNCDVFLESKYIFLYREFLVNGGDTDLFIKGSKMINDILCGEIRDETQGLILILRPDPEYEFAFIKQFTEPIENKIIIDGIPQISYLFESIKQIM